MFSHRPSYLLETGVKLRGGHLVVIRLSFISPGIAIMVPLRSGCLLHLVCYINAMERGSKRIAPRPRFTTSFTIMSLNAEGISQKLKSGLSIGGIRYDDVCYIEQLLHHRAKSPSSQRTIPLLVADYCKSDQESSIRAMCEQAFRRSGRHGECYNPHLKQSIPEASAVGESQSNGKAESSALRLEY